MVMTNDQAEAGTALLGAVEPAANLLKALSHPQRLMIVCTLMSGERAVSELERDLSIRQPSLSQHLASLREAGVITGRRKAKAVLYRLSDHRAALLADALHAIFCEPARVERRRPPPAPPNHPRTPTPVRRTASRVNEAAFFARMAATEG